MKIRLKLIIGYAIISLFSAIVGFWGMLSIEEIGGVFNRVNDETIPLIRVLKNLRYSGLRIVSSTSEFVLISAEKMAEGISEEDRREDQDREEEEVRKGIESFHKALTQYDIIARSFPVEGDFLEEVRGFGKMLKLSSRELIDTKKRGGAGYKILEIKERFETHEEAFLSSIDAAINREKVKLSTRKEKVADTIDNARRVSIMISISTLILALIIGMVMSHSISVPLIRLKDAAREIGKGNFGLKVRVKTKDEIQDLANDFNEMSVRLADYQEEVKNHQDTLEQKIRDRTRKLEEQTDSLIRSKEQLLQADRMASLGTLAVGVAHEINNPNQNILSNSQMFEKFCNNVKPILDTYSKENGDFSVGGIPYSKVRRRMPEILSATRKASERISRIVGELGDFTRQRPADLTSGIDLNASVRSAISLVANMLKQSTQFFSMNLQEDLPKIEGNFQSLEQVVINLLINACQALPDKSKQIEVSTSYDATNSQIVLKVRDEGEGIEEDDLRHIFDPFFTTRRDSGGTGLGLSISRTIIDRHNGSFDFISEVGKGSTAIVRLPVRSSSENKKIS